VAATSIFAVWGLLFAPEIVEETAVVTVDSTRVEHLAKPPRYLFERPPVTERVLDLQVSANELGFDRFTDFVPFLGSSAARVESLRVQYTLDTELTRHVFDTLRNGRVALGHVILLDPNSGRVLAYVSTDIDQFPPTRTYPAASLIKVITVAAALDRDPGLASLPCRYQGSPYALPRSRIDPPKKGLEVSLRKALASSYNQCFAQLAVHVVGGAPLMDAISRFGWLSEPAPAHSAGSADLGEDLYDIGKLGCGLAGTQITPLHAAQLAATLARGELVAPHWVEAVYDPDGRELPIPATASPRQVITPELAAELRAMLTDTTLRGTARRAFRKRNGRPLLGPVKVAGKTGSLSGTDPTGRYEWFAGVAPADQPRIAVAVLVVQSDLWWRNASQIAAEVLQGVFCEGRDCRPELAARWIRIPTATAATSGYRAEALN
jgi:cell division protein FtsI/penicillin-binding protein 2